MDKPLNIEFQEFFSGLYTSHIKPITVICTTVITYLIMPSKSYVAPAIALWVAVLLDIFSRFFANSIKNGGFFVAVKSGKISSETLWRRTVVKVVAYLFLQTMVGLAFYIVPFHSLTQLVATVVYSFLFLREAVSILENLIEAGVEELAPLKIWFEKQNENLVNNITFTQETITNISNELDKDKKSKESGEIE